MGTRNQRVLSLTLLVAVLWWMLGSPALAQAPAPAAGEFKVAPYLDDKCEQHRGRIVVPQGMTASGFRLDPVSYTLLPCAGPSPPDFHDFCIFSEVGGRSVYHYWYVYKSVSAQETAPLAEVVLGPGTYHVYAGGGKKTEFEIHFTLGPAPAAQPSVLWGAQTAGTGPLRQATRDGNTLSTSCPVTITGVNGLGTPSGMPGDTTAADCCVSVVLSLKGWPGPADVFTPCLLRAAKPADLAGVVLPPGRYRLVTGNVAGRQEGNRVEVTWVSTPQATPTLWTPAEPCGWWASVETLDAVPAGSRAEGKVLWQFVNEQHEPFTPLPALGPDGTIYATAPSALFAVGLDGRLKWRFPAPNGYAGSPVVGPDGTIYFVSGVALCAVGPDGKQKWRFDSDPGQFLGPLALGADGTLYTAHHASGVFQRMVMAVSAGGKREWAVDTNQGATSSLTIGPRSEVYYTASPWQSAFRGVKALEGRNGSVLWSLDLGGGDIATYNGMAVGKDGTLYVPLTNQGRLVAVSPSGSKLWEYSDGPYVGPVSLGPDGTVYAVFSGTGLHALAGDGTLKWKVGGSPAGHGSVVGSDGVVYFAGYNSGQGWFTAANPDGKIRWTADIPAGPGSPVMDAKGVLYVLGGDRLTAVQGSAPAAASGWARGRGDRGNTGAAERSR